MMGLPKRWIRQLTYVFSLLGAAFLLVLFANKHDVINVDKIFPQALTSLTPSFFQPPSDLYIIDIAIGNCYKVKGDGKRCGVPKAVDGRLGNLFDTGGWFRIDKDLGLGTSWTKKQYFSYKRVNSQVLSGRITPSEKPSEKADSKGKRDKTGKETSQDVIVDIAISNPTSDSRIKGNRKIPEHILDEFHATREFNDADLQRLREEGQKNSGKKTEALTVDKDKAASNKINEINKKIEKEQKEKAEKEKAEKEKAEKEKEEKKNQAKRTVETDRFKLERMMYIPTDEEIKEAGWVAKSNGIWVKYGKASPENAITGIDILFGEDAVDPRPNWRLIERSPLLDTLAPSGKSAYLTIRRGPRVDYSKYLLPLKLNKGKFKILQVADLHFSTGVGNCRDPSPADTKKGCEADPRTLRFLESVLDIEKPDLVVLTGDQVFGQEAPDAETAVFKALNPFVSRKIPFAVTLGNHDDEGSLSRSESMALSANLPYSIAAMGPEEVDGVGNYIATVEDPSNGHSIYLYFLDTHKYSQNPKVTPGYDWIKESQLKWLEREDAALKKDAFFYSKKHLSNSKKDLSMAFFHIPLPEYRNTNRPFVGKNPEGVTAPKYNSGARKVLGSLGVSVVSVGHDHCNDYCLQDVVNEETSEENKMWLCYGGGSGEGGYGGYGGYIRRMRVFELDPLVGNIRSWKRAENDPEQVFDDQVLVSEGTVANI
ncbi:Metallo-dependent phosphatase [Suhomyces tanzawaensis NRRL Y-17324]|uniref:Metallo-dependent phosphatase n=1 Tax=Suhomyces tanzawaensis NRRL Y-17324 TaxID=984487 RepID=A0A1E4SCM1_9ASCO|nr:Metallo-dependent phosphatase [Suhomyces tanzawaensis NRRL Y-17324]ODV77264.1 Metallo-dependent phosphatase [Suhomyces tanzawaensis NRRL Y-17324]